MKTWTVGDLVEALSKLPANSPVFLEDADTNWIIDKFELSLGHATREEASVSPKGILIRPSNYGDMDSSLEFRIDR